MIDLRPAKELLSYRTRQNQKVNQLPVNLNESKAHFLKKYDICRRLRFEGKNFYAEAIFKNKKRADIFVLEECTAYEIAESETEESLIKKQEDYPCKVIVIRA